MCHHQHLCIFGLHGAIQMLRYIIIIIIIIIIMSRWNYLSEYIVINSHDTEVRVVRSLQAARLSHLFPLQN